MRIRNLPEVIDFVAVAKTFIVANDDERLAVEVMSELVELLMLSHDAAIKEVQAFLASPKAKEADIGELLVITPERFVRLLRHYQDADEGFLNAT
jgi:hypothetical protein